MPIQTPERNLHRQFDGSPPTQKKATRSASTWETRGLKIDGEYLSHLRFADDILICADTPQRLQQMLQELADEEKISIPQAPRHLQG